MTIQKPTRKVNWNPSLTQIEPTPAKKSLGWAAGEKPPYEYFNWVWKTISMWEDFIDTHINVNNALNSYHIGHDGSVAGTDNTAFGKSALKNATSSAEGNIAIGNSTLESLTTGRFNVAIGKLAGGSKTTTDRCVYIGPSSGQNSITDNCIGIGFRTFSSAINVTSTVAIGVEAGANLVNGSHSVIIGRRACQHVNTTFGDNNVTIGSDAMRYANSSADSVSIGRRSCYNLKNSWYSVVVGSDAGYDLEDSDYCTLIGYNAGYSMKDSENYIAIGTNAGHNSESANNCIAIGSSAGYSHSSNHSAIMIGALSGYSGIIQGEIAIGTSTLYDNNSIHGEHLAIGYFALRKTGSNSQQNIAIGEYALIESDGRSNIAIGVEACSLPIGQAFTGARNVVIGHKAHRKQQQSYSVVIGDSAFGNADAKALNSIHNVYIGAFSGTDTGAIASGTFDNEFNTFVGAYSGNMSSGNRNTFLGARTGMHNRGSNNVAIGEGSCAASTVGLTIGSRNVSIGNDTLSQMQEAFDNVSIGYNSCIALRNASRNTCIGFDSGYGIVDNSDNVLVGYRAGRQLNTGVYNVAVGTDALRMDSKPEGAIAIGYKTAETAIGHRDIAIGLRAMQVKLYAGNRNIAIGGYAMHSCGSGHNTNVAIGDYTLTKISSENNVAVGHNIVGSADGIFTGSKNVFVGNNVCDVVTPTTRDSVVVGADAFSGRVSKVEYSVLIGSDVCKPPLATFDDLAHNVVIGYRAGRELTSNYNILLGTYTGLKLKAAYNIGIGHLSIGAQAASDTTGQQNVALGSSALTRVSSGSYNTAIGNDASSYITTGSDNICTGYGAGAGLTTGSRNIILGNNTSASNLSDAVMIGHGAGENVSQDNNVLIGKDAGRNKNTNGSCTAVGFEAMKMSTSGNSPRFATVVGRQAAQNASDITDSVVIGDRAAQNASLQYSVAIGTNAGRGTSGTNQYSTFIGYQSAYSVTTGKRNNFIGYNSGYNVNTGSDNVYIGSQAASQNLSGNSNIAIGTKALQKNPGGSRNIAIGEETMSLTGDLTSFNFCIAIGYQAGLYNRGNSNIFIGDKSGCRDVSTNNQTGSYNTCVGDEAGRNMRESSDNTLIGRRAGSGETGWLNDLNRCTIIGSGAGENIRGGDDNILIGYRAGRDIGTTSNTIVIGNTTAPNTNNIVIGNSSHTRFTSLAINSSITGGTTISVNSSGNVGINSSLRATKTDIEEIDNTNWLHDLAPVSYKYKDALYKTRYGLIAEDVEQVNSNICVYDNHGRLQTVDYIDLIAPLLKEVQNLKKEIELLKSQLDYS